MGATFQRPIAFRSDMKFHTNKCKLHRKNIAIIWPKYCRYGVKHYIINHTIKKNIKSRLSENFNQCVYQGTKTRDSLFIAGPVNTSSFNTYIYDYCYTDIYNASNHCKLIFMT